MYPTAITQQAVAAIEEHRDREAEPARQARAVRPEHGRLTRALIAIGKAVPAASLAPWLAGRS
jgi:hypothetical protein